MINHPDWLLPGSEQPHWPSFAFGHPAATLMTTLLHDNDTVMASMAGQEPRPMPLSHLAAFLKDGKTHGLIQISGPGGAVIIASFAQLRGFIFGPLKHDASMAPAPAEQS